MGPCDIKSSAKAWNDGIEAFKKAFKQTGGKTTESIKYAVEEINKSNPELDFDVKSFADPLVNSLKEKGIVPENYKFQAEKTVTSKKQIEKIVDKMKGVSQEQKKTIAKKAFSKFHENGMLDTDEVKNIYAEAIGIPAMDEKFAEQIKKTSAALKSYDEIENRIKAEIKFMQEAKDENGGKLSPEKDKSFKKAFENLAQERVKAQGEMMKEKIAFSDMLIEKRFWLHQLGDYMPLNLMNPRSLSKNISGAVVDGVIRALSHAISSPVSAAASVFTGINSNPIGARARGTANADYKNKTSLAWKYGQTDFSSELPQANHLNAARRFKQAMDATGMEKFKGILSAALKIHPSLISKALTAPDAFFYEMVRSQEINRIAEAKGLKGAEKEAFMLDPDEKSVNIAADLAKKATFKQDVPKWLTKLSNYDAHERAKKLVEEGKMSPLAANIITGIRLLAQKSAFPFVKTPVNIVRTSARLLLPEYDLAKSLIEAKKETDPIEKQRLIVDATTKAAVGFFIRYVALQMVSMGLISAGYNDEDKKTKDFVEQEMGGPNRMNWSAFIRGLTFRDMSPRKGDNMVDLSAAGALGMTMNVYSHAFSQYGKEDMKNRTFYNKDLLNSLSVPANLGVAQITSSLDQTFLTGMNQILDAFKNEHGFELNKLGVQYASNLFTGIIPSTAQQLSTQVSPNVKRQFDAQAGFGENLANKLGYNFAGQSGNLKDKYFSLAEKEGGGLKKKHYMFFDNYMGRVLEAETDFIKHTKTPGDTPIHRLYDASREAGKEERDKLFPASINDEVTIQTKKHGKNKTIKVSLTDEQHNYLQEQASNYRMILATPFIMSDDFKKADFETKTKVLQSYYQQGLKYAKEDLKRRFPDYKKQIAEAGTDSKALKKIEKRYKVNLGK